MRTSLNLTDQDVIAIHACRHVTDLASNIATEALKAGADVLVEYIDDRMWRAWLAERDEKYLARKSPLSTSLAETITAEVNLWGPEDPKVFDRTKPERMAKADPWMKEISDRQRERKVRSVNVDLDQVTPQRARKYGVSFPKWKRIVNAALGADLKRITARGQLLGKTLSGAPEVTIASDGTELTLSLPGRDVFVSDGIVDANDIVRGDLSTSLPTGTARIAPVETSADGTVVFPSVPQWGKMIRNLRWTFKGGRLVDYSADKNLDVFKNYFEASIGDKDRIGSLSVGLNPRASYLGGFVDHIVAGAVTIGIGKNEELGGQNKVPFAFDATLPAATLKAGAVTVVDRGKLKM